MLRCRSLPLTFSISGSIRLLEGYHKGTIRLLEGYYKALIIVIIRVRFCKGTRWDPEGSTCTGSITCTVGRPIAVWKNIDTSDAADDGTDGSTFVIDSAITAMFPMSAWCTVARVFPLLTAVSCFNW